MAVTAGDPAAPDAGERSAAAADLDWLTEGLAEAYPAAAAPTRSALAAWRRALETDGGGWRYSRLTGDGFPIEVVWRAGVAAPAWTVEVGGPGLSPAARLTRAARLAGVEPATAAALHAMQATGPVSFGAWLGARPGPTGVVHKLYVEVPAGAERQAMALVADALGGAPLLTTRAVRLNMLGLRPADGGWEAYHRVDRMEGWELERVAGRAGLPGAAAPLLDAIADVLDRPRAEHLPGCQHGVSLARVGGRAALTVFLFARALGGDLRIRRRLGAIAAARGWDDAGYQRLAAGAARDDARTDHGIIGFTIDGRGTPSLTVGLRPRAPRGRC